MPWCASSPPSRPSAAPPSSAPTRQGTLTENQLTVVQVRAGQTTTCSQAPATPPRAGSEPLPAPTWRPAARDPALAQLLLCAVLCNDATLTARSDAAAGITGDPTEAALLVMAAKAGRTAFDEARLYQRVDEHPFSSDTKMMAVVCSGPYGPVTFVKGASSAVMPLCSSFAPGLSPAAVTSTESHMADGAMRVLALAWADGDLLRRSGREVLGLNPGLTMLGLVGMVDPVRPEATEAIKNATLAGVRTIMITGDSPATAVAIARGARRRSATPTAAVTGEQLDQMDDARLRRVLDRTSVFARVAPAHKLRIVRALKARGQVVAMTGDGVNDAPALREADIGIAMGLSGTDVAREAASMVLTDDNYATIVAAIEEGRSIYDNIRKFIRYLLASNIGEILTMLGTVAAGLPLPLTPIQLLWMNLLTDGLPAMALAADPTDPAVMKRPPRSPSEGVFSGGLGLRIAAQGVFMGACTVACYILAGVVLGRSIDTARTMAFHPGHVTVHLRVPVSLEGAALGPCKAQPSSWRWRCQWSFRHVVHTRLGRQALGTTELSAVDQGWSCSCRLVHGAHPAARSLRRALRRRFRGAKGKIGGYPREKRMRQLVLQEFRQKR